VSLPHPKVRFTTTADGVEIAFWEIGSGPTLLLAQNRSLSHAELEWTVPAMADLYQELARYFRLVRFDPRGSGVSADPTPAAITLDGMCEDIAAVVDALDDDHVTLVGAVSLGPTAIRFAVANPDRIDRLVLCDTGPRLSDLPLHAYVRATDALVDLGVVPSLGGLFPATPTEDLPALERLMRGSLYDRPAIAPRDLTTFDVTEILGEVTMPTLVIKSDDSLYTDMAQVRSLLSGIPSAEMRRVTGTMAPWLANLDEVLDALVTFLTAGRHRPSRVAAGGTMTVVFTDLVGSSQVLSSEGDDAARQRFRAIDQDVTALAAAHGGRVVKGLGDGSLVTFASTRGAIAFSLDLQDRMKADRLGMRIGMAAGEPIEEDGDVYGAVVVQASRIADLGGAGDVLVSDSVRQLAVGKDYVFDALGDVRLKGFDEAQRVWRAARSSTRADAAAEMSD
jgi:class 3 adenylate cyclase